MINWEQCLRYPNVKELAITILYVTKEGITIVVYVTLII